MLSVSIQRLKILMDGLSDSMFLVPIQWLKIPMDGFSDSMSLVLIRWLKTPMDELIITIIAPKLIFLPIIQMFEIK